MSTNRERVFDPVNRVAWQLQSWLDGRRTLPDIGNLERSPFLTNVSLISSVIRRQRNDTFYEFSMSAQFVPPAVTEPESTPAAEGERQ